MTITVNGRVRKVEIGCRTFISINELLRFLDYEKTPVASLELNNISISKHLYGGTMISGGDKITFFDSAAVPGE